MLTRTCDMCGAKIPRSNVDFLKLTTENIRVLNVFANSSDERMDICLDCLRRELETAKPYA